MSRSTRPSTHVSRLLHDPRDVTQLLRECSLTSSVILTARSMSGVQPGDLESLKDSLRNHRTEEDRPDSVNSLLFPEEPLEQLGHAPIWIDLGGVYGNLIQWTENQGRPDSIFCLDRWAAQLRERGDGALGEAGWYYISEPSGTEFEAFREYGDQLEEWLAGLQFRAVIPSEILEGVLSAPQATRPRRPSRSPYLQRAGSWTWHTSSGAGRRPHSTNNATLFIVHHSGSIEHLRIFLESYARMEKPPGGVQCIILAGLPGLAQYVRWFNRAHVGLRVEVIEESSIKAALLKAGRDRGFQGRVVTLDDHFILPSRFLPDIETDASGAAPVFRSVPIGVEATAQIIASNLDVAASYDKLLEAFSSSGENSGAAVQVLSSEECAEDIPSSPAVRVGMRRPGGEITLLRMGDLP